MAVSNVWGETRQQPVCPTAGDLIAYRRAELGKTQAELGMLLSLSPNYISRIERDQAQIAEDMLPLVCRVLTLDVPTSRHLYRLNGCRYPRTGTVEPEEFVGAGWLADTVANLTTSGAAIAVFDRDGWGTVQASNQQFDAAFPGLAESPGPLWWMFASPVAGRVLEDWEQVAAGTVARLRHWAAHPDRRAEAQKILDELAELHYFRAYWFRRDLSGISRSGRGAPLRVRDGAGQVRLWRTIRLRPTPADSDAYVVVAVPEVEAF
ncbi:helix-turn-helix domain-containing protein [Nocardia stercoris]|uniref:XRE family transcriptional regulator n=1 Tax=Nocardia stercoris TaxID=2483361 RepID=A0A3M2LKM1_9NOCA|nr:helix-turn-helix domain-containing protein [Nocardia stercoris]RMI35328.1 XRE family transcriptional regulator [Nocardia stercoris]